MKEEIYNKRAEKQKYNRNVEKRLFFLERIQNALQRYKQNQVEVVPLTDVDDRKIQRAETEMPRLSPLVHSRMSQRINYDSIREQHTSAPNVRYTDTSHDGHIDPFDERTAESRQGEESVENSQFQQSGQNQFLVAGKRIKFENKSTTFRMIPSPKQDTLY